MVPRLAQVPIVLSIEFVVMVAVGGLGNIYGAVACTIAIPVPGAGAA